MTIDSGSQKFVVWLWLALIAFVFAGLISIAFRLSGKGQQSSNAHPTDKAPEGVVDVVEEVMNRPVETMTRGYVSSDSCRECHA